MGTDQKAPTLLCSSPGLRGRLPVLPGPPRCSRVLPSRAATGPSGTEDGIREQSLPGPPKEVSPGFGDRKCGTPTVGALGVQPAKANSLSRRILPQQVPRLRVPVGLVEVLVSLLVEGQGDERHRGARLRVGGDGPR